MFTDNYDRLLQSLSRGERANPGNIRISFYIFQKGSLFLPQSESEQSNTIQAANSRVISGSITGVPIMDLSQPIQTSFYQLNVSMLVFADGGITLQIVWI